MAEKTFDELLSGAQTIRDNELPESNTHTLVGEQLVNMVEKNKEESGKKLAISDLASGRGESTTTAMTQAAVTQELETQDEKLTELSENIGMWSLRILFNTTYQYTPLHCIIKKGSTIHLESSDGISHLNFYQTSDITGEDPQLVVDGSVAEKDLTYVRCLSIIGGVTISVSGSGLDGRINAVDERVINLNETINDSSTSSILTFTHQYDSHKKLSSTIKKGSVIHLESSDGIDQINMYESQDDGSPQLVHDGDVAEKDLNLARNLTILGTVTVSSESIGLIGQFIKLKEEVSSVKEGQQGISSIINGNSTSDTITYTQQYSYKPLAATIKKGSVIHLESSDGIDGLNMYEEQIEGTAHLVYDGDVAEKDFNYARNLNKIGTVTISSELPSIVEQVDELKNVSASCIIYESIINQAKRESLIYLDDLLIGDKVVKSRYSKGLTSETGYISAGNIAWCKSPIQGTHEGQFILSSPEERISYDLRFITVAAPAKRSINMLDIGSSYIDIGIITKRQKSNYEQDGHTVTMIGTMGTPEARMEAQSGGTWNFVTKPMGRSVIVNVTGVSNLPTTGYPGTTYEDANGIKWTVRGVMISQGSGKLVLSSFNTDPNYSGNFQIVSGTDYEQAAGNMPSSGILTKTTNDSTGSMTDTGDDTIQYNGKELVYYNPFWNPETNVLDFKYYINKWGFPIPDVVSFTFGSNDLGNTTIQPLRKVNEVCRKAKDAVDKLHEDYPNCKILITSSCYGYAGTAPNEYYVPIRESNLQNYYKSLVEMFGQETEYSSYVAVVPTLFMIDRLRGYNTDKVIPCSLYPDDVTIANDVVHPNTAGFNQFADAMTAYAYHLIK